MRNIAAVFFIAILTIALVCPARADVSPSSVEEREKEIGELIKNSVGEKDMRPEATVQLQNPAASPLAQPAVSTLAQPHETLSMSGILDLIKATSNILTPDENLKPISE